MSRQITIGTSPANGSPTSLPVTDASMTSTREPVIEQTMSGKGGEVLYGGLYSAAQGTFSGAYRPSVFNAYILAASDGILADVPASHCVIVYDDFGNALKSATTYISSVEISMRVGELAKCTFNFVGQGPEYTTGTPSAASFTADIPIFYKSSTTWGACSELTIRIERPYAADDYILGGPFLSQSIYQSGDMKVTGTIKLSQNAVYQTTDLSSNITVTLMGNTETTTITITNPVLTQAEIGVNGRGLINKTQGWACESDGITIVTA